tara:strand:+ start:1588 stop:1692 length:105 start_codon:yes stop_codon:yes gene_type:complete
MKLYYYQNKINVQKLSKNRLAKSLEKYGRQAPGA